MNSAGTPWSSEYMRIWKAGAEILYDSTCMSRLLLGNMDDIMYILRRIISIFSSKNRDVCKGEDYSHYLIVCSFMSRFREPFIA